MLGTARHAGKRIEHTTTYLLRCPASTVPEAMRASRFINMESSNSAKQMAVIDAKKNATPPNTIIDSSTLVGTSKVSPLTTAVTGGDSASPPSKQTTPGGMQSTRPKPMPKLIRKNSRMMQKHHVNMLALLDHAGVWWRRHFHGGSDRRRRGGGGKKRHTNQNEDRRSTAEMDDGV